MTTKHRICRVAAFAAATITLLVGMTPPAHAVASGTALRKALVVYVTWQAGNGSPAAPAGRSLTQVTDAVGKIAKDYYVSVSHGYFPGWTT
jgi:hypothetical protein